MNDFNIRPPRRPKKVRDSEADLSLSSLAMDTTKAGRQIQIKLEAGLPEMPVHLFNRFKIASEGAFALMFLGFVFEGELMDSSIVAISNEDLKNCYQSMKSYIAGLGDVSVELSRTWGIPRANKPVLVANSINFSHTADVGELLFSNLTFNDLATMAKGQKKASEVACRRVDIVRCDLVLYKQMIGNLFNAFED